jgi:uncharacterized protein (TIGR00645 family)
MLRKTEHIIEQALFSSRWLLAPLYVGLIAALMIMLIKFMQKFISLAEKFLVLDSTDVMLGVLGLVDIVLVANLLLIIIFSGYENFVSKIDFVEDHKDRPDWMDKVDYAGLKIKVIGSIVAISSIEMLKVFISIQNGNVDIAMEHVMWLVIIHMVFILSGVLFAVMERIMHPIFPDSHDKH